MRLFRSSVHLGGLASRCCRIHGSRLDKCPVSISLLALVTDQVGASVLCPYFVPTGINQSHRNKPSALADEKPTRSQLIGQAMSDKAVTSGKVTAAEVAQKVFDAIATNQFYIYSHPQAIGAVQTRLEDVLQARNPTDPFAHKPSLGEDLKAALRKD